MRILKSLCPGLLIIMQVPVLAEDIYVYPNHGQSYEQQSRERYDCHLWAVGQTNFDPTDYYTGGGYKHGRVSAHYPPHRGIDPITGAAGGAALGALGGAIGGDAGKGAAIGAGVGALAGIFNAASNNRYRQGHGYPHSRYRSDFGQDRANYRRAISACLEARGYTVR